jgi:hypothetical protein
MKHFLFLLSFISFLVSPLTQALEFNRACDPSTDSITIGGVGDLLIHKYIHNAAQNQPQHYSFLWQNILSHTRGVDVMYANLETPLAAGLARDYSLQADPGVRWDEREYIYSGYPAFNTPPMMARNLVDGGFDIVSTANNHASDRGRLGIDMTIDSLERAGLQFTGTRRQNSNSSYTTIVNKKGNWLLSLAPMVLAALQTQPSNRKFFIAIRKSHY